MNHERYNKILYWVFVLLLVIHTIEEYYQQVYRVDLSMIWLGHALNIAPRIIFLTIATLPWALLILWVGSMSSGRFIRFAPWLIGLLSLAETQHIISTIYLHKYYPGTLSASLVVLWGIIFLITSYKGKQL